MKAFVSAALLVACGASIAQEYWEREISTAELEALKRRPGVVVFPQTLTLQDSRYFLTHYLLLGIGKPPECRIGEQAALVPDRAGHLPASEQVATDLAHCEAVFRRGLQP